MLISKQLRKSYGPTSARIDAIENLSLTANAGETLVMVGPNACGKSTLIRLLLGLELPTFGDVVVTSAEERSGAVLQDYRSILLPWATVADNILLATAGLPPDRATLALDSTVAFLSACRYAIDLKQTVGTLSGGQQQAVALARALIFKPGLRILDEPTSAIDASRLLLVLRAVLGACQAETVLYVTHSIEEALLIATRIIVFGPAMHIREEFDVGATHGIRDPTILRNDEFERIRAGITAALGYGSEQ